MQLKPLHWSLNKRDKTKSWKPGTALFSPMKNISKEIKVIERYCIQWIPKPSNPWLLKSLNSIGFFEKILTYENYVVALVKLSFELTLFIDSFIERIFPQNSSKFWINGLKGFISILLTYTITEVPNWNAPAKRSKAGRFQRTKTFNAVFL